MSIIWDNRDRSEINELVQHIAIGVELIKNYSEACKHYVGLDDQAPSSQKLVVEGLHNMRREIERFTRAVLESDDHTHVMQLHLDSKSSSK